jgi:ferric-dicitrate binding protein FerR (iron transport regulator)
MRRWTLVAATCLLVAACEENTDFQPPAGEAVAPPAGDAAGVDTAAPSGGDGTAPAPGGDADQAAAPATGEKAPRRFLEVKGAVTIDDKPAALDMAIPAKAVIVTGDDGHAVISVVAGSLIEVRARSRVELGTSERKRDSLKLLAGALWSMVPNGTSYEVQTDNAVAGVRGTIFFVEKAPKSTYICDCNGEVELFTGKVKKPVLFKSNHEHTAVRVFPKQSVKAKRENHTDAEMAELLKIVPEAAKH